MTLMQAEAQNTNITEVWQRVAGLLDTGRNMQTTIRFTPAELQSTLATIKHTGASMLFIAGVCENSGSELDWLWLAKRLVNSSERRYCAQRALAINPNSEAALAMLAVLPVAS